MRPMTVVSASESFSCIIVSLEELSWTNSAPRGQAFQKCHHRYTKHRQSPHETGNKAMYIQVQRAAKHHKHGIVAQHRLR